MANILPGNQLFPARCYATVTIGLENTAVLAPDLQQGTLALPHRNAAGLPQDPECKLLLGPDVKPNRILVSGYLYAISGRFLSLHERPIPTLLYQHDSASRICVTTLPNVVISGILVIQGLRICTSVTTFERNNGHGTHRDLKIKLRHQDWDHNACQMKPASVRYVIPGAPRIST
ncbi:hypothetical protein PCANC_02129 [Puccinia coronata f. sp. avenae]|uniref:Uncharacterized protein n=1 Tax=Puccinia coronata f. sp. avenae TaxID=200324 RepID=A0A2N5TPR5_9BASI|nr:hypothetical protein PCASD_19517 [Puccinia coronata f. sp. avenae]PLW55541.1 hypothetical protein PCANC_02129 [Puccinia coronata f. sp. avenae]